MVIVIILSVLIWNEPNELIINEPNELIILNVLDVNECLDEDN